MKEDEEKKYKIKGIHFPEQEHEDTCAYYTKEEYNEIHRMG